MSGLFSGIASLSMHSQDALTFAVLAIAAGYLLIRAYRTVTRQQPGASCGACPANRENPTTSGCGTERDALIPLSETSRLPPP